MSYLYKNNGGHLTFLLEAHQEALTKDHICLQKTMRQLKLTQQNIICIKMFLFLIKMLST